MSDAIRSLGTRHTLLAASPFTLSGTRPKGIKEARSSGIKGARTEGIKGVLPPSRERGPKASRESCPEAVDGSIDSHTDRQKDGQMVDRQTDTHAMLNGSISPHSGEHVDSQGHAGPLHSAVILQRTDTLSRTHGTSPYDAGPATELRTD